METRTFQRLPVNVALLTWIFVACGDPSVVAADQNAPNRSTGRSGFTITWSHLPDLPPADGQPHQLGLAGPFVGLHNDALLVAGGANFPHGAPWEPDKVADRMATDRGGKKVYWNDIYVLTREDHPQTPSTSPTLPVYQWRRSETALPHAVGYGVAVSTDYGLICIGGESKPFVEDDDNNVTQTDVRFDDVFVLRWDPASKRIDVSDTLSRPNLSPAKLPDLPRATSTQSGTLVGSTIYLVGGDHGDGATKTFWSLDLRRPDQLEWVERPPWPGPARVLAVAAAQNDGIEDCLYLFSGRSTIPGETSDLLTDAYCYRPSDASWKRIADAPHCLMAGTGIGVGVHHVLTFGGDDGTVFQQLERLALDGSTEATTALRQMQRSHPGFNRDILAYHTVTDTWVTLSGQLPESERPVTTTVVRWGDEFVIPSGEVRPAVRTSSVLSGKIVRTTNFGVANVTVLVVYLVALVAMGFWFSRRVSDANDFFTAGQRIPWWAAGLSIFGTQLSAITFMAIPAKTYSTDWRLLIANLTIVAVAPLVVFFFLPFYRRLNVTTAYEYLEKRFNRTIRLLASGMFVLLQFGRIGVVLLLPSIALSVVTGINVTTCIGTMGLLCILYTVLGGIEAVIWTDVMQVVVLVGGAILCLILISNSIDGGWDGMIDLGESAKRFRVLDFHWNWRDPTFFVILIGAFSQNLISYGSDQSVIQRYLTTHDEAAARRGIWTAAILAIPASLIFFMIGTALFAYFKTHPAELDPGLQQTDAIFPHYIINCMPPGVAGLVIAALFAAAMSSLDSSMNSVAAAITADFYRRPGRQNSTVELRIARLVTLLIGLCGTLFAIWMSKQPGIKSLWDTFAGYIGLFGGGLCGLFLLAIFTTRTSATAAGCGLVASALIQFVLQKATVVSPWLYSATGIAACFCVGYIVAFFVPERRDLSGLTMSTLDR